jgi:tetratricopeptide (TPR) repeat protein
MTKAKEAQARKIKKLSANAAGVEHNVALNIPKVAASPEMIAATAVPAISQTEHELHDAALTADLTALRDIEEIDKKVEYKRQALINTDYQGFADRFIASVAVAPSRVFAWFIIWLMDVGRWDDALKYLRIAVKQDQPVPDKFTSQNWFVVAIDNICEQGGALLEALEKAPETVIHFPEINKFYVLLEFVKEHKPELNAVVAAKLYVSIGKLEQATGNNGRALANYLHAQSINSEAGVKTKARALAKDFDLQIEI